MFPSFMKHARRVSAAGALLFCSASSTSAGLFCNWCVEPMRPYFSPECEPNWGHYVTQWRQFPELSSGSQSGDYCPSCEQYPGDNSQLWTSDPEQLPTQNMYSGNPPQVFAAPSDGGYVPNGADMHYNQPPLKMPAPSDSYQYQGQPQILQMPPLQSDSMLGNEAFQMPPVQNASPPQNMSQQYMTPQNGGTPGNPIPMQDGPQPGQRPAQNTLNPQPLEPRQFNPTPQPQQSTPGELEMPPLPDQTGLQRYNNRRQATFSQQQVPVTMQSPGHRRVFNGRLQYGRYGGPIPPYQQPESTQAQPLVMNSHPSPARGVPVQGISFSKEVPEHQPGTPLEPAYKKWLKLPRLPSWK